MTSKGVGGKKGFGKGGKAKGGKGKGSLYPMEEVWPDPRYYGYDAWAINQGGAEALSCLRTIEAEVKPEAIEEKELEADWITVSGRRRKKIKQKANIENENFDKAEFPEMMAMKINQNANDENENFDKAESEKIEEIPTDMMEKKMHRMRKWKKADKEEEIDKNNKFCAQFKPEDCHKFNCVKSGCRINKIKPIVTIEPESLNVFSDDGIWEEIEMAVDSGATESVVNDSMPSSIPTTPGPASRRGVEYEVANGARLPNEGEKKFSAMTSQSQEKQLCVQVCDVNQGLLSVSKATAANNRVVFDSAGSYIENKDSGEITWLEEKKGMYMLKLWVRRPF